MRMGKYYALFEMVEGMARQQFGQTTEQEDASNELLPEYMQRRSGAFSRLFPSRIPGTSFTGIGPPRRMLRTPLNVPGDDPRQLALDIAFIVPWGDLGNMPMGVFTEKFAGPYWGAVFAATGYDPFMGRRIRDANDSQEDQYADTLEWMYQYMMPALMPAPTDVEGFAAGAAAYYGVGKLAGPLAGTLAGIGTAAEVSSLAPRRSLGGVELRGSPSLERLRSSVMQDRESAVSPYARNPSRGLTHLDVFGGLRFRPVDDPSNQNRAVYKKQGMIDRVRVRMIRASTDFMKGAITEAEMIKRQDTAIRDLEAEIDKLDKILGQDYKPVY